MSLQPSPATRVFMELVPWADRGRENHPISPAEAQPIGCRPHVAQAHPGAREVHVSGAAEVSASPDRALVTVRVSSTKEVSAEAKKSVCRRLDYITQTLQQQGLLAENVSVTKNIRRVENAYHMEAETPVTSCYLTAVPRSSTPATLSLCHLELLSKDTFRSKLHPLTARASSSSSRLTSFLSISPTSPVTQGFPRVMEHSKIKWNLVIIRC